MAYFPDVSGTVRRMISRRMEVPLEEIDDEFRWAERLSEEDAGWFLGEIQKHFAFSQLFGDGEMGSVSTVGALIRHVESRLKERGY